MLARFGVLATVLCLFGPPTADIPTPDDAIAPVAIELPTAPSFAFATFDADPIAVKQYVLPNGLTVLLSENHERPEVFGAVVVRTGGKNDPADNTGMAHYLEHMLFKGTQTLGTTNWPAEAPLQARIAALYEQHQAATSDAQRAALQAEIAAVVEQTYAYTIPNELDRMLEEIGSVEVNAFTTEDETVYHNSFPASQIDAWLAIYAHRFVDPVFRLFPTELQAVYEEKNISLDRFEAELYEQFLARAFPTHPYGTQSVLGEVEHLERPSLVAMQQYFDKYYVANNMALVLAGDFDAEAIMPIIAARFGVLRSGPDPAPRTGPVAPFVGRERMQVRLTPIRVGAFGFRTPTARDPDYAALQVVRELLSNEQGSGYIDQLVNDGKLLIALPFPLDFADHGFDVLFYAPRIFSQSFAGAERLILAQFERIARGEFDERTMLAIRDDLRRAEDRQWESNEDRALALADSFVRRDSWQDYLDYRAQLASLTREDVMRVAATYFGDDHLSMRSRLGRSKPPKLSKPDYPTVTPQPGVHSQFYTAVMSRPRPPASLDYVDFAADVRTTPIADGASLTTNKNPFNDTYSLEIVFGVGRWAIPELEVAAQYIERLGTRSRSPAQVREQLSRLGTSLELSVTDDRTYLRLTGPDAQLGPALELLDELLREPVGDRKRLRVLARERAATARVTHEDPAQLLAAAREFAMYGEASTFLRDYGRAGMRGLDSDRLLDAWRRAQSYAVELRYAGSRDDAELVELFERSLSLPGPRQPAVPYLTRPRVLPERDTVFFLPHRRIVQTQLAFVVDGDPVAPEQRAIANAYNEYIGGGMTGLIFQEVREYRALAYAAWGAFVRDPDPTQRGFLLAGVGCQTEKTDEAIAVVLGMLDALPAKPDRIDALRSALSRGLEAQSPGFRDLQRTIAYWRRLGYSEDPRRRLLAEYPNVEFADIAQFHEAQVADRPVILVVVADPRKVDRDALARYGELVELSERDVFAR